MQYKLKILPSFERELVEITSYISETLYAPKASRKTAESILKKINRIKSSPTLGKKYISLEGEDKGFRYCTIKNYAIFYIVNESNHTIEIRHVFYARRDFNSLIQ
ncbi:MAG: type II toxin-antitoxin system RelE/ParE family toxin [Oscillospiraceae bacterium]|nr:type II toxin-antitoxin system RelE/ParE family toxin [Oscillospiraceae bacterium]